MRGITRFQRQNGQFSSTEQKTGSWPEKLMMRKPGRTSRRRQNPALRLVPAASTLHSLSVRRSRQRHACEDVHERGHPSGSAPTAHNGPLAPPTQVGGAVVHGALAARARGTKA